VDPATPSGPPPAPVPGRYADFIQALQAEAVQPLWDRYHLLTRRAPQALDAPWHWPWEVMEPLVQRAVREVSMEDAERRVLLMANPAYPDTAGCTTTLSAGLQTLLPGEVARAHRHTLQAIRFVMEGEGAITSVNDHRCPMAEGDLVLTPAWTWHEHTHPGQGRVVWFDGLDLPLARYLDTVFLELGNTRTSNAEPVASRASALQPEAALLPPDALDPAIAGGSPYRYAWARAHAALMAAPRQADGSRLLRYVHPASGGAVLPTLDCYLQSLAPGRSTQCRRSTSNAVCVVVRGEGASRVGEQAIRWRTHDVFTVPHWNWVQHTAASEDAVLFLMTDREFIAATGYLREEAS
jgi:gentisate 1,2-dioxygenase